MSENKENKAVIIPTENFDGICDEVLDGFLAKLYYMSEKEREKAQDILRKMSKP